MQYPTKIHIENSEFYRLYGGPESYLVATGAKGGTKSFGFSKELAMQLLQELQEYLKEGDSLGENDYISKLEYAKMI